MFRPVNHRHRDINEERPPNQMGNNKQRFLIFGRECVHPPFFLLQMYMKNLSFAYKRLPKYDLIKDDDNLH
jgi:hypothetical protein